MAELLLGSWSGMSRHLRDIRRHYETFRSYVLTETNRTKLMANVIRLFILKVPKGSRMIYCVYFCVPQLLNYVTKFH